MFHRISATFWALLLIPALIWWRDSVTFVILASVYANIQIAWSGAQVTDEHELLQRLARIEEELTMIKNSRRRGS
jgi:hypothetical protein